MSLIPLSKVKRNGKVDIWDLGPIVAAKPPQEPAPVDPKLKGPELAAAEVAYEDAMIVYKDTLRAYNEARKERRAWDATNGGPRKIEMWGIDARHALEGWPDRYKLDLPKSMKPGRAQVEADEQAEIEAENLERMRAMDPQFGRQGAAA